MAHPLDGARLKVVWAQEHIDTLKAEIRAYLDKRPYEVTAENKPNFGIVGKVTIIIPPPMSLSALIGDCATNARATLDYIVWELAGRYFSPPFNAGNANDRRITSFPISNLPSDAGYVNRLTSLANRKIPAVAIDEIKAVQPYNEAYQPLWWLHELVNTDKHRMPILTLAYVPFFAWGTEPDGTIRPVVHWGGPGREAVPTAEEAAAMRMEHQVAVCVTFQDVSMPREGVDRTLENIVKCVADIVPRFEPFF
jgi:hypothetical protein